MNIADAVTAVRAQLGPDLLLPSFRGLRPAGAAPSWGCCYVAAEAVQALADERLTPATVRVGMSVHWFLRAPDGRVVDPTWDQFELTPDYAAGRGRGFLTKEPSKRARKLLDRIFPKDPSTGSR